MRSVEPRPTMADMQTIELTETTAAPLRGLRCTTLCDAFAATVAAYPERPALRMMGHDEALTWAGYADRSARIAAGLHALGLRRGDAVALMLSQRLEAACIDAAAMQLGVVTVSLYPADSRENVEHVLADCGASVLFTEAAFAANASAVATADRTRIEHLVSVDGAAEGMLTLAQLEAGGDPGFDLDEHRSAIRPDDTVSVLYTSGTTGPPKGVVHTHATVLAGLASFEAGTLVRDEVHYVSFLPLAHLGERGLGYWRAMVRGSTTTYCPDPTQLARALVEARPTWIFAAPRIWERLMAAITADAREEEPAALRERFGLDRLEHAITGAAPCPEHVLEFFRALGIPIVELWGMTEVWIGTLTRPGNDDIGTVGRAQAGFELRLAPDGELLIRGPAVTPGYLNRPDATAELFDTDGWLRTGDLATIDGEGRVRIVDRKKEMFISSAGHNMSPANIEAKLKASSPLIAQVCCFGDGRDYNIAVITLEPAAVRRFVSDRGVTGSSVAELALEPTVLEEVAAGIARANEQLDGRERIVRHAVLPDEWTPGVELTPTMKLRRRSIAARYGSLIDGLYSA